MRASAPPSAPTPFRASLEANPEPQTIQADRESPGSPGLSPNQSREIMRKLALIIVIALVSGGSASQAQARCHGTRGYPAAGSSAYIDIQVKQYLGMSCARAVQIAAAAYDLTGLRPIFDPKRFGGGGFGGPFHVGHLYCWLNARGSDFRDAACWHGRGRNREYVKFYDHRDYYMATRAHASRGKYCGSVTFEPNTGFH